MIKDGSLRRGEIGVLPQFSALDALAPDALVFRHVSAAATANSTGTKEED